MANRTPSSLLTRKIRYRLRRPDDTSGGGMTRAGHNFQMTVVPVGRPMGSDSGQLPVSSWASMTRMPLGPRR
jgi:hypothetical protein